MSNAKVISENFKRNSFIEEVNSVIASPLLSIIINKSQSIITLE